jgi:hypothetical protein
LTEIWPIQRVRRAFEEADRLRLFDGRQLEAVRSRAHGRHGLAVFAQLLAEHHEPHLTRSELERRFLALCAGHGLPPPVVNGLVLGHEVDFHWPGRRLVVEVDGYAFHHTRASFERDRERDAALHAAGYVVLRLTDRRLESGAETAMGQVRQLLAVA